MQWQARRSSGAWHETITKATASIHDASVLRRFICTDIDMHSEFDPDVLSEETDPWLSEEKTRLQDYFTLLIELAAARAWSQIQFQVCQPNSMAACLHEDRAIAGQMLQWTKRTWKAILEAEQLVQGNELKKVTRDHVRKMLDHHVCWHKLQVARESDILLEQESWNVDSPRLRDYCVSQFGAPANTKFTLEDLFAHLTSVGKLSSLATPMSKYLVVCH